MKYKAVIFDFDGTIMDTAPLIISSWQKTAMAYLGRVPDESAITPTFGELLDDTCRRIFVGFDPEEVKQTYRSFQNSDPSVRVGMPEGTEALIRDLYSRGIRLAIVTSRLWSTTNSEIYDFPVRDCFEVIIGAADTDVHKPDPTPLLLCLERLGISPGEAIYIGDTKADILCAGSAGVDSVLVAWTRAIPRSDFGLYNPDYIIEKAEDLYSLLEIPPMIC